MAETIYDRNMALLRRVPLPEFIEHLVAALRSETALLNDEMAGLRREEGNIMATLEEDQAADKRLLDAMNARDAREKATIAAQATQIAAQGEEITAQGGEIAGLKATQVPDAAVQAKLDLAAQIEAENQSAENQSAENAAAEGQGAGAGANDTPDQAATPDQVATDARGVPTSPIGGEAA